MFSAVGIPCLQAGEDFNELALEQAGMSENVFFRRWQDTHNLSLTNAAHGYWINTPNSEPIPRTGARPVPHIVGLACKGWEVEQSHPA